MTLVDVEIVYRGDDTLERGARVTGAPTVDERPAHGHHAEHPVARGDFVDDVIREQSLDVDGSPRVRVVAVTGPSKTSNASSVASRA